MSYFPSENWIEQVKAIAHEFTNSKTFVSEGIVTSVKQTAPYTVKVNLQPYGIETGWLKIATPYGGPGFGFIFPAPPENSVVKIIFDMGDIKNGTVIGSVYNQITLPPTVPYGTVGFVDPNGTQIIIKPDGSCGLYAPNGKGITIALDGTVTIAGKTLTESW